MFVYWANEAKSQSFEANNFKLWARSHSEKYSKYKDFSNLMIKKWNCKSNKIKEYISLSDGKENINSFQNKMMKKHQ